MIINLRGTNGSGKSALVRTIMSLYPTVTQIAYPEAEHKRRPMGYICRKGVNRLFIPGHYEIANGGIDTLPSLNYAYDLILKHHEFAADVLFEGKNLTDNIERLLIMHQAKLDISVIFINLSVADCIKAVRARGHAIQEKTIEAIDKKCKKEFATLSKAGVKCLQLGRAEALKTVAHWLDLELPMGGADVRTEGAERMPSTEQHHRAPE
jgi:ABC-type cobalamin/Fe3+-siderophores transport system ATPase subunit